MRVLSDFKVGECFKDTLGTYWVVLEQLGRLAQAESTSGIRSQFFADTRQEQIAQVDFLWVESMYSPPEEAG